MPRTDDQVFLDKFFGSFTCSYVQWTSFFPQVFPYKFYFLVCTAGQVFLDGNDRPNLKTVRLSHDVDFNYMYLSSFPCRPYTRTIFLVQKQAWTAFEQGSLSRKNLSSQNFSKKTWSSVRGLNKNTNFWLSSTNVFLRNIHLPKL